MTSKRLINCSNNKNILLAVTIFLFGLLVIGGTYAYLTFSVVAKNNVFSYDTTCFDITYDTTGEDNYTDSSGNNYMIAGTLFPSSGPSGGLVGQVSIGIKESCNVNALGNIYLNINNTSSKLFNDVEAHCENSQTLKTMTEYTTEDSCNAATNGTWVTTGNPLKYAIYNTTDESVPIKVGYINKLGEINIYKDFIVSGGVSNYNIYIWLDGNITDNSYGNLSLEASMTAELIQADCDLTDSSCYSRFSYVPAVAIYSSGELRFYRTNDVINVGDTYDNRTVEAVYTDFEDKMYNSASDVPWSGYQYSLHSVTFVDTISPINTSYWFSSLYYCSNIDVTNLNVSGVTNMKYMFYETGYNGNESFTIVGLDNWDTSNVTNMEWMFAYVGRNAWVWDIGDLSGWNTSKVTNMEGMFSNVAVYASDFRYLDLRSWNVDRVEKYNEFDDNTTIIYKPNFL